MNPNTILPNNIRSASVIVLVITLVALAAPAREMFVVAPASHPHPVLDHTADAIWFTSDDGGTRAVRRFDLKW